MASITAMANVMATAMDMAKIQKDKYLNIYELELFSEKEPRKGLFFLLSEIKASPLHC